MRASEDPTPSSTEKREAYQQKLHMKEMTASKRCQFCVYMIELQ